MPRRPLCSPIVCILQTTAVFVRVAHAATLLFASKTPNDFGSQVPIRYMAALTKPIRIELHSMLRKVHPSRSLAQRYKLSHRVSRTISRCESFEVSGGLRDFAGSFTRYPQQLNPHPTSPPNISFPILQFLCCLLLLQFHPHSQPL